MARIVRLTLSASSQALYNTIDFSGWVKKRIFIFKVLKNYLLGDKFNLAGIFNE